MNNNDKKIVEAALTLLKNKSWKTLTLKEIKIKSKIKGFDKLIVNKNIIIKKINEYVDHHLSIALKDIEESNNKDKIFEILMMRFDILQKHRRAIISIFNDFKFNPRDSIIFLPNILDSIILMINSTNISSKGFMGQLNIKGIFIVYVSSFYTWTKDETVSLEKTMITLDNNLDKAGKILNFIK